MLERILLYLIYGILIVAGIHAFMVAWSTASIFSKDILRRLLIVLGIIISELISYITYAVYRYYCIRRYILYVCNKNSYPEPPLLLENFSDSDIVNKSV
jgi:hypothetical protein